MRDCAPETSSRLLAGLSPHELEFVACDWLTWARREQLPPARAQGGGPWTAWLFMGGRGAGKTRAGAEWVRGMALGLRPYASRPVARIALVGETAADVREVMIEGVSGLLAIHSRFDRPVWIPSRRRLEWRNGAVAQAFSAEDPEALRGPQFGAAWSDELAKWKHAEEAWDMLQFGLRLGRRPRQMATTTPRPTGLLKKLMGDPSTAITRATTRDNARNLAPTFLQAIVGKYAGTRLGRQELDGEIIEERAGSLWTRAQLEECRVSAAPDLARIVVAVDPPAGGKRADACGIVVAGRDTEGRAYVLEDATIRSGSPHLWAAKAVAAFHAHSADALVAEANQGGEMVRSVIGQADPSAPVTLVHATRGKWLRAEPVAHLYAQGKVRHVGPHPALEDEMCDFSLDGLSSGRSPDRLDALVWALAHLMLAKRRGEPRVRGL